MLLKTQEILASLRAETAYVPLAKIDVGCVPAELKSGGSLCYFRKGAKKN